MTQLAERPTHTLAPIATAYSEDQILAALGINARDPKAQAALLLCQRYNLDPFLKHLVLIKGNTYITRDALLYVAHRSGVFDGIEVIDMSETPTHFTARVSVYRKDMSRPFTYPGRYPKSGSNKEFAPEMAIKVAEVMALRRAFSVAAPVLEERWDIIDVEAVPSAAQTDSKPARANVLGTEPITVNADAPVKLEDIGGVARGTDAVRTDTMTKVQLIDLGIICTQLGYGKDEADRVNARAFITWIIRRSGLECADLMSVKDLTRAQATAAINLLSVRGDDGKTMLNDTAESLMDEWVTTMADSESDDGAPLLQAPPPAMTGEAFRQ